MSFFMVSSSLTKFISLTYFHEHNKHSGIKTMFVIKSFCLLFLLVLANSWLFFHPIIFDCLLFILFENLIMEIIWGIGSCSLLPKRSFIAFFQVVKGSNSPEPMLEDFWVKQMIIVHIPILAYASWGSRHRVGDVSLGLPSLMCIGLMPRSKWLPNAQLLSHLS